MDVDAVIAEVASAVGLAEGESGVRDILRVIVRGEPVAAREIGRGAELPVPIVTAVCSELRKRGIVDRSRPVRLTAEARETLAAGQPRLSALCPCCGGRGLVVPDQLTRLTAELELAAGGAPEARPELDQSHCTVATKIHRVLRMHESGALTGNRILLLGDDDLICVAIAYFAAMVGAAGSIRRLAVVDADPAVLSWAGQQVAGTGIAVELAEHDLRLPLPARLRAGFDVVCTDPPYTVAGAELFLSRAVTALSGEPGQHVFFSFGARRPLETLRTQELIARAGFAVRSLTPGFNEYLGAGILSGTSNLYHLRSTSATAPLIEGDYFGPLYTADDRVAADRPYRCAGCGAVHRVGPGGDWQRIKDLQAAGCPACGEKIFRPMALQQR